MVNPVRIYRFVFSLADRFVGLPERSRLSERVRARAILCWTFFAVPIGLLMTAPSLYQDELTLSALGEFGGILCIVGSVVHLKATKETKQSGLIFAISCMFVLGLEPLITGDTTAASLVLLSVSPVMFGFLVDWKRCVQSAAFLLAYYPAVYLTWQLFAPTADGSMTYLFSCAGATFACGFTIGMSSWATAMNASRLRSQKKQIEQLALTDPLTGLFNRRAFNDALAKAPSPDEFRSRTLMLLDLNDFKSINDRFGHDVGDAILTETGHRIEAVLRNQASVYRLGGDEFAILYDRSPISQDPEPLVQAILAAFEDSFETNAVTLPISCSIGCETALSAEAVQKQLLRHADIALFEAKLTAGGSWQQFNRALGDRVERRRALVERLPSAISERQIDVFYQPQHRTSDGCVLGFEALSRWTDAKYGDVPPEEFIRLAEETGQISGLDRTMIETAIEQAEAWLTPHVSLCLNVSGSTLTGDGFVEFVERVIADSSLTANQIQMEITETTFIDKWETARDTILALNEMGVSLALDDFGTGYSSLSYLSAFPIDLLKIDRSFLRNAHQSTNIKVMQSIMNLAGSLELDVLIEGVETEHHLSIVKLLGCQKIQGYFYSKPLPAEDCGPYLVESNRRIMGRSA